jgi:predicted metal-dependent phosphotriesterase family hydrolase
MHHVNTVLGPVSADELGVVSVHEALLSVYPGAQFAYDITIDRAEIFATLAAKLRRFKQAGGGTVVDSTGMYHGRDVRLLEALSRSTGVHVVASTGLGPEAMLGGYFLTPQTLPPTPWSADQFAALFTQEVTDGMVVPRVQRRAGAGLVAVAATATGMTAIDENLLAGAARTARLTGVPASIRFGADAMGDLDVVLDQQLPADRVVVGGLDRRDAVTSGAALAVAARGAYVAIDHIGSSDDAHLTDAERLDLVVELLGAGHADRVLLSSDAIGCAIGHAPHDLPYDHVLASFIPLLRERDIDEPDIQRFLVANPRNLLSVTTSSPAPEAAEPSVASLG